MKLLSFWKKNLHKTSFEEIRLAGRTNFLKGKNVLITGAGRNIGRSIALEMVKEGANIFFTEINIDNCRKLKKELEVYSGTARGFISDISNLDNVNHLYKTLLEENINIDILIHNAGISMYKGSDREFDINKFRKLFDTNVIGPVQLTKSISKMMIDNNTNGSIIFITSIHQWTVFLDEGYSASKSALGMIIKELALELAPYNIRVNGIAPGHVIQDKEGRTVSHKYTPLYKSSISPCYIGRAAVFLSSDYFSKHTTGTVIKIDGGLTLYNHWVDKKMQR